MCRQTLMIGWGCMAIDIKNIILHLRQYLGGIDGFESAYSECKSDDDKKVLLEKCKDLIVNGWSEKYSAESKDSFFIATLKPILKDPTLSGGFFSNKPEMDSDANQVISHFGRYCLFRYILEMYQTGRIPLSQEAKIWFLETNKKFQEQLQNLFVTKKELKYGEQEFNSYAEIKLMLDEDFAAGLGQVKNSFKLIAMAGGPFLLKQMLQLFVKIPVMQDLMLNLLLVFILLLARNKIMNTPKPGFKMFSSSSTDIQVSHVVNEDINIKKFVMTTDEEIEKIFQANQLSLAKKTA